MHKKRKELIITIDGPAGSGKSTTAQRVAQKLDYQYLDSGALYRAITLYILQKDIDIEKHQTPGSALEQIDLDMRYDHGRLSVWLNHHDVSEEIRSPAVTGVISRIAAIAAVRDKVNTILHRLASRSGCVAEGRDMGSVVFPHADLKIYMSASLEERSKRRQKQYHEAGVQSQVEEIRTDLQTRDFKDTTRQNDPLIRPEDSVYLDNSAMTFEQQVQYIIDLARQRGA